ncbi:hypothetical protein VCHENC02_5110B, partial [Vibrio harveyi]
IGEDAVKNDIKIKAFE